MKKEFGFVLAAAILLAGCGQKKETTTTTARPVKTTIVESRSIIRKDFSGIVEAVGGRMKVLVDGGIRSGVDIFKALALGADGVLIARPFVTAVYGCAAEGVQCYVDRLVAELADTMAMCGASTLSEISGEMIWRS